ncbi:unnamed protein product [Arabidopsis thaliana]|uniref:Uncharacterized protein n=1 Tax=Arabidopsis thaliana TaxID=3702 RepID=A0A5S9WW74_ARATH|nr:unnamed protein product [Arabidopsis thaliana]
MGDENLSGSRNGRPEVGIVDRVREFVDQDEEWSKICRPGVEIVDRDREFVDQAEEWSRICRPGVEIVDRDREFVDQDGGTLDQDDEWSMKIYRVRGMVDQGLKSSTRSETSSTVSAEWSRICRPGVEIVDRDREFVDQDGGMLDQADEWAMKIYGRPEV